MGETGEPLEVGIADEEEQGDRRKRKTNRSNGSSADKIAHHCHHDDKPTFPYLHGATRQLPHLRPGVASVNLSVNQAIEPQGRHASANGSQKDQSKQLWGWPAVRAQNGRGVDERK
jgi:hypothetical protein